MRFCFDIDGVIAELRKDDEDYSDVLPKPGAFETLTKLKNDGHYIILYTARCMERYQSNLGKINAKQGLILYDWLDKYKIPYDEIYFGKPSADFYIDDKAIKFTEWEGFWENKND
jgi:capsule biosynthesis phosphatase